MIIILGTAHGENVAGKRSPDGKFREYKYSREIVARLKKELESEGYTVFVDMPEDKVPARQSVELIDRVNAVNKICDKYGARNCIFVSIHNDAKGNGTQWESARGWSVYTTKGVTRSDTLATFIWEAANRILPHDSNTALRKDMSDGDPDFESNLYVLKYSKCPAVLTENLFQDNKKDVEFLTSEKGKAAIVKLHKEGILKFINR